MSITIIDESGKAYERRWYRNPRAGDTFIDHTGYVGTTEVNWPAGNSKGYCHILEEIPNPYVKRSDVDELVAAAIPLSSLESNAVSTFGLDERGRFRRVSKDAMDNLAAALEKFSPPEVQERWTWKGDSIFDGDKEFNIANVEGCEELVATLNTLSKSQGES